MSIIDELVQAFQVLPGVGQKTSQRMVLHLLQRNRSGGSHLGVLLEKAMSSVLRCQKCQNFTEESICRICCDLKRNSDLLCVVESAADVLAFEQAGGYDGFYFVLHGRLSPLDGIGPDELGLGELAERIEQLEPEELVLATNPTVEGEATAHYITQIVGDGIKKVSRIAHGVPLGSEIEYADGGTLTHALQGRRTIS
jgi:recombination protein RecR